MSARCLGLTRLSLMPKLGRPAPQRKCQLVIKRGPIHVASGWGLFRSTSCNGLPYNTPHKGLFIGRPSTTWGFPSCHQLRVLIPCLPNLAISCGHVKSSVVWRHRCIVCVCVGIESRHLFEEEKLDPPPPPPLVVVVAKGREGWIDRV